MRVLSQDLNITSYKLCQDVAMEWLTQKIVELKEVTLFQRAILCRTYIGVIGITHLMI
jgi:hypothetical protein